MGIFDFLKREKENPHPENVAIDPQKGEDSSSPSTLQDPPAEKSDPSSDPLTQAVTPQVEDPKAFADPAVPPPPIVNTHSEKPVTPSNTPEPDVETPSTPMPETQPEVTETVQKDRFTEAEGE